MRNSCKLPITIERKQQCTYYFMYPYLRDIINYFLTWVTWVYFWADFHWQVGIPHLDLSKVMYFKTILEILLMKESKVERLTYRRNGVRYSITLLHVWNEIQIRRENSHWDYFKATKSGNLAWAHLTFLNIKLKWKLCHESNSSIFCC